MKRCLVPVLTVGLLVNLGGCHHPRSTQPKHPKASKHHATLLKPADFVRASPNAVTRTNITVSPSDSALSSAATQPISDQNVASTQPRLHPQAGGSDSSLHALNSAAGAKTRAYHVAGMVGQVNGNPIYAHQIFDDLHERLTDLGRRLPRGTFYQQARQLLQIRLRQIVMDALILGEAEGRLTEQQQSGLLHYLTQERKKLVRELGQGSEALASARSRMTSGLTLDQRMDNKRHQVVVQNYLREKLFPKINVSRKDIERYYNDHQDQFNSPPGRVIHLIRTRSAFIADLIDKELRKGRSFLDVAGDKRCNPRTCQTRGLFGKAIKGDHPFGNEALNKAVLALKEGQYSKRLKVGSMFTWVYVAKINQGVHKSLLQVQLQIERLLRQQQYVRLSEQYQKRLLDEGSYNDQNEMLRRLMDIAMSLYAPA